ncbi:MAG: NAD(P)H-dependent oxidoreductase [Sarcina sp.]
MNNKINEIMESLEFRHACKEFDSTKQISDEEFKIILEAGRLAPSSMGLEPWKFVVIDNQEYKDKLGEASWGGRRQIPSCSKFVVLLTRNSDSLKYDSEFIDHLLKDVKKVPEDIAATIKNTLMELERARFDIDNRSDLMNMYSNTQTHMALMNMMQIAAEMKIDSCAIGGFDKETLEEILLKEGMLDKKEFIIGTTVAFGYRLNEPRPKTRQSFEDVVSVIK